MMYPSAGLPSEEKNRAKPFLGAYAEEFIRKIREKRGLEPGATALYGAERQEINAPNRVSNYT